MQLVGLGSALLVMSGFLPNPDVITKEKGKENHYKAASKGVLGRKCEDALYEASTKLQITLIEYKRESVR